MGNGSSNSRPNSAEEQKDEDEFKPVKNWEGEVVGWVPRTDSDKLRRKQLKEPPPQIKQLSDSEDEDKHSRASSRASSKASPSKFSSRRSSGFKSSSSLRNGSARSNDSYFGSDRRSSRFSNRSRSNSRSRRSGGEDDSDDDDVRLYPNSLRRPSLTSNMSKDSRRTYNSRRENSSSRRNSRSRKSYDGYDDFDSRYDSEEDRRSRKSRNSRNSRYSDDDDDDRRNSRNNSRRNSRNNSRRGSRDNSRNRRGSRDNSRSRRGSRDNSRSRRGGSRRRSGTPDVPLEYKPVRRYPSPNASMKPKPRSRFSRENCVSLLHSAFKGLGTNEKLVIDVLGGLGREQRVEVARGYKARYRTDLIAALRDELSGLFEDLCVALVTEPLDFDVKTFHQLIQHETRHMALVGLLAQATSKSLKAVRKKYKQDYEEDLLKKIDKESNGAFEEIFTAIYSDKREEDGTVDNVAAQKDAMELQNSADDKEKDIFRMLLVHQISHRHCKQIRELCEAYRQIARSELTESVHDMLGSKDSIPFIAFFEACDDPASFFAGCIRHCFDGIGTDDACLIRLFVYRCEIDMGDIAEAYQEMFDTSLAEAIKKETSGDYKKLLLKMLGEHGEDGKSKKKGKKADKEAEGRDDSDGDDRDDRRSDRDDRRNDRDDRRSSRDNRR